jgi:hypothetical protein
MYSVPWQHKNNDNKYIFAFTCFAFGIPFAYKNFIHKNKWAHEDPHISTEKQKQVGT